MRLLGQVEDRFVNPDFLLEMMNPYILLGYLLPAELPALIVDAAFGGKY